MSNIFDQFLDELAAAEGLTVDAGAEENDETVVENDETNVNEENPIEDAETTENDDTEVASAEESVTGVYNDEVDEAAEESALLAGEVAEESTTEVEIDPDEFLTEGLESALLLDTLKETCTKEEFTQFIAENKTELELYGLVNFDALATESFSEGDEESEAATEARNIVRLNREAQISREEARISIGLAKKANDALYKYYHKYAELKRKFRDKIYEKYSGRARGLARKAVMNSRNKASVMNSKTGSTIINKIDSRIKDLDKKGRNNEAVKKPVR